MLRGILLFTMLAAVAVPCRAGEGRRIRACLTFKGLADDQTEPIRKRLHSLLDRERGPADQIQAESGDCCVTAACLKRDAESAQRTGVLVIEVLRLGPLLKISMRGFDARTQATVFELATTVPMRGFQEQSSLGADLRRALLALGVSRTVAPPPQPGSKAAPQHSPAPPTRPSPAVLDPASKPVPNPAEEALTARRTDTQSTRTTLLWLGGVSTGVAAGALATGMALLLGPMKSAQERRDTAYREWLAATTIEEMERLQRIVRAEDGKAHDYWVGGLSALGAGALLLGGGLVCFWLVPAKEPSRASSPASFSLTPLLLPEGAGFGLAASF
ncbi:MAG: hypothetical protein GYA21_02185 [Myxococcales bacterium]|nr:hypothetical protein [Myxococcales bacterium]